MWYHSWGQVTRLARSTIYVRVADGSFPQPIRLGAGPTHEGGARAPGPAVPAFFGDPREGAGARSRQPSRVSERARKATREHGAVGALEVGLLGLLIWMYDPVS